MHNDLYQHILRLWTLQTDSVLISMIKSSPWGWCWIRRYNLCPFLLLSRRYQAHLLHSPCHLNLLKTQLWVLHPSRVLLTLSLPFCSRCLLTICLFRWLPSLTNLSSGDVPSSFKHGLVFPSIKKTTLDPEAFDNFRPITNLSFLSKTVERLVAIQLRCTAIQSAYRAHHSTETAAVPKQPYFESITTPT